MRERAAEDAEERLRRVMRPRRNFSEKHSLGLFRTVRTVPLATVNCLNKIELRGWNTGTLATLQRPKYHLERRRFRWIIGYENTSSHKVKPMSTELTIAQPEDGFQQLIDLVRNAVPSPHTKRAYQEALKGPIPR